MCIILTIILSLSSYVLGGCDFDPASPLFNQEHDTSSPAHLWSWDWVDKINIVENTVGWPAYQWMPDAHMSAVKDESSGAWYTFYPNSGSYRTRGSLPFPDMAAELDPEEAVVGGPRVEEDVYDNGGDWLMATHHTGPGDSITGFIHAEDHYWSEEGGFPGYKAFKSIALGKHLMIMIFTSNLSGQLVARTMGGPGTSRGRSSLWGRSRRYLTGEGWGTLMLSGTGNRAGGSWQQGGHQGLCLMTREQVLSLGRNGMGQTSQDLTG